MTVSVVDLFCGVGGMTHGFKLENLNVVAGVDIDENCRYPYEANNSGAQFHKIDLLIKSASSEVEKLFPDHGVKVLIGCAPCQPYSTNSQSKRRKDDKWKLVPKFAEIVTSIRPEIVSMENVPQLVNSRKGHIFTDFVKSLEDSGYHVWHDIVYAPEYGVPQKRKRLVLLASLLGEIQLEKGSSNIEDFLTVNDAIGDLPLLKAGEIDEKDSLHRSQNLSDTNLKRIRQSVPGGTWEDWDADLLAKCHKKASGSTYKSVYGRMRPDEPSPTITTQAFSFGSGRFGHPVQDRALSLREMAILQTFPKNYIFAHPEQKIYFKRIGTLIGNAVPVVLGQVIARSIETHLSEHGVVC